MNAPPQLRLHVLTLYTGEPQLLSQKKSLAAQSWPPFRHRIFEYLPNIDAHRAYQNAVQNGGDGDIFLKLDADMVLSRHDATKIVTKQFAHAPQLDHLVIPIYDYLSNSRIIGAHCFSSRARWRQFPDSLFVDPDPEIPGQRAVLKRSTALAMHMVEPTIEQSFFYGFHRGLKILQFGRHAPHEGRRRFHQQYFQQVQDAYLHHRNVTRLAALIGYHRALNSETSKIGQKNLQSTKLTQIASKIQKHESYYHEIVLAWLRMQRPFNG